MRCESKSGQQLWKAINIRVFGENNQGSQLFRYHARPGCWFKQDDVDKYLESVAAQVEKRFPQSEYTVVALGPAHFNFVWKGERKSQST